MTVPRITPRKVIGRFGRFALGVEGDRVTNDADERHVYVVRHDEARTNPILRIEAPPAEAADWLSDLAAEIRRQANLMACPTCGHSVDPSAVGVWEDGAGRCDVCREKVRTL